MILEEFLTSVRPLFPGFDTMTHVMLLAGAAGLLLTPAERLAPASAQPVFFRKGLWLDAFYWFATPLLTRCLTAGVLVVILFLGVLCIGMDRIPSDFLIRGFGPISRQPLWLQAIEILLLSDFIDYWTHRTLHKSSLWRIHAIHHSPEEMNWLSSSRVHPLNDLITRSFQLLPIAALGFSAAAIVTVVPLVAFYVMFLHSNIRWDFGPLRWVLVSPAYHRWHHSSDEPALDKNFSGIFPIWDVLFGTAYFPRTLPTRYGLHNDHLPESLVAHLAFPFTGGGKHASTEASRSVESAASTKEHGA